MRAGNVEGLSNEALTSSRTVLSRNQGGGTKGLQQIFTPHKAAEFINWVVGDNYPVLDLTAGNGSLLAPYPEKKRYGVEIDKAQVEAAPALGNAYQALVGDVQRLFPLMRAMGLDFPVVVLNPPFSLEWEVPGLGKGSSTKLAVDMARKLLNSTGLGVVICGARRFAEEVRPDLENQLFAVLTVEKLFPGVDHECCIAFWRESARTLRNYPLLEEKVDSPVELTRALADKVRMSHARIFGSWYTSAAAPDSSVLSAIQAEYDARLSEKATSKYLLWKEGGRIRVSLSAYARLTLAKKDFASSVLKVEGFDRQPVGYFALQEKEWRWLRKLAEDTGLELESSLVVAVEASIQKARTFAVPLYRLPEVQRLGFLDNMDEILCKKDDVEKGYVAGRVYDIYCATKLHSVTETREKLGSDTGELFEVEVKRKGMQIRIGKHTFEESEEELRYLLSHFEVPDPGDIEKHLPERVAFWRGILRQVEKEIQQHEKGFLFFDFQVEDTARQLAKMEQDGGGTIMGWEQGLGKSVGQMSLARALELGGKLKDECPLFNMPQDLARQFSLEAKRFFGKQVLFITRAAQRSKGSMDGCGFAAAVKAFDDGSWREAYAEKRRVDSPVREGEATAVQVEEKLHARRMYLKAREAWRKLKREVREATLEPRPVPGLWSVTWYEALAITGSEEVLPCNPEVGRTFGHKLLYTVKKQEGGGVVEYVLKEGEERKVPRKLRGQRRVELSSLEFCPSCRVDRDGGWNGRTCRAPLAGEGLQRQRRRYYTGWDSRPYEKVWVPSELNGGATSFKKTVWSGRRQCGHVEVTRRTKAAYHRMRNLFGFISVDEGTKIKGESQTRQAVCGMRARWRVVATGTPVDDYVMDLFWLLWWAIGDSTPRFPYAYRGGKDRFIKDFGVEEYKKDEEGKVKGRAKVLPEASNMLRLWKLLCSSVARRRMDEVGCVVSEEGHWKCRGCGNMNLAEVQGPGGKWVKPNRLECPCCSKVWSALVPLHFNTMQVPWGVQQKKLFAHWLDKKNFARYFKEKHPETQIGENMIQLLAACLGQFTLLEYAGTMPTSTPEDAKVYQVSPWTPAMLKLLQTVEGCIRKGGKVLIGSCLVAVGPWVAEQLQKRGLKVVAIADEGGPEGKARTLDPKKRGYIITEFRKGAHDAIAVGVEAAALGHNMDHVTDVVLFGLPWRYATLAQFISRARRLSSKLPVTAHLIIPRGSLSWKKWEVLQRKMNAADLVMDGKIMARRERGEDSLLRILEEMQQQGARFDGSEIPEGEVQQLWLKSQPLPVAPGRVRQRSPPEAAPVVVPAPAKPVLVGRVRGQQHAASGFLPGMEPLWRTGWMDPPWEERGGGGRGAQNHYPLLRVEEMPGVIRASGLWKPYPNAHLYLWVTNNFLPKGIWLMEQLGFRYVTDLPWVKPGQGLGQYFRGEHELMLFGVRGQGMDSSVMTGRKDLGTVIEADYARGTDNRIIHSAKPPEAYERVEARSKGPYMEFFGRGRPRLNWRSWGNEALPAEGTG